jgi:1,4-dihydroxy-2-naphthoyl-CoA hydrolase
VTPPAAMLTPEYFNELGARNLPGLLGVVIRELGDARIRGDLEVTEAHMAPNGYLHAGAAITIADTLCGYGCIANLPSGASGFTTVETKSNHLGTARSGRIACVAERVHGGKTTQVWDAVVTDQQSGRRIAIFRCTQMILYAKAAGPEK